MSKEDMKDVKAVVTYKVWKSLKHLALAKDTTLNLFVKDVLEKIVVSNKKILGELEALGNLEQKG